MTEDPDETLPATPRSRAARYRAALRCATLRKERGAGRHVLVRWSWLLPWSVIVSAGVTGWLLAPATPAGLDAPALSRTIPGCPKPVPARVARSPFDDPVQAVVVIVSKTQILVGDDPAPVVLLPPREEIVRTGAGARYKRGDPDAMLVAPLAEAIERERMAVRCAGDDRPIEAVVVADATMPYRLLMEVLFTLGQGEVGKYHLMVRSGGKSR